MPRCDPYREALAAAEHSNSGLEEHLASCEACRVFADDLQRLTSLARDLPATASRPEELIEAAPLARLRLLALAAALLLAVGALVWGLPRGEEPLRIERPAQTAQPDLFAALERAQAVWAPPNGDWTEWIELPETGARFGLELLERDFEPRGFNAMEGDL